jgi:hypothetical protein
MLEKNERRTVVMGLAETVGQNRTETVEGAD